MGFWFLPISSGLPQINAEDSDNYVLDLQNTQIEVTQGRPLLGLSVQYVGRYGHLVLIVHHTQKLAPPTKP